MYVRHILRRRICLLRPHVNHALRTEDGVAVHAVKRIIQIVDGLGGKVGFVVEVKSAVTRFLVRGSALFGSVNILAFGLGIFFDRFCIGLDGFGVVGFGVTVCFCAFGCFPSLFVVLPLGFGVVAEAFTKSLDGFRPALHPGA